MHTASVILGAITTTLATVFFASIQEDTRDKNPIDDKNVEGAKWVVAILGGLAALTGLISLARPKRNS